MERVVLDEDPGNPRHFIPYIEFYITNVCNLTCSNCNRFNNFDFKGHQRWSDYESEYAKWSKHVRLQRVTILGGEPLLNPSILDWIYGINRIFKKTVQILTNGTRLNQVNGLYEAVLADNIDPATPWVRNWIGVSLHNTKDRDHLDAEIRRFLRGNIRLVKRGDPEDENNATTMGGNYAYVDENNVKIPVWEYTEFYNAAVIVDRNNRYRLYNNDVERAHAMCGYAMYKCYHFIRGALYKCGPVALFPEFDQQHAFDITAEDRQLLGAYRPLIADEFPTRGQEFMATIDQPIPQCKFCPTKHEIIKIAAVSKKKDSQSGFQ